MDNTSNENSLNQLLNRQKILDNQSSVLHFIIKNDSALMLENFMMQNQKINFGLHLMISNQKQRKNQVLKDYRIK